MTYTSKRCAKREYRHIQKRDKGDYVYAEARTHPRRRSHVERGYGIAQHFAEVIAERQRDNDSALDQLFHEHVERWKGDTGHLSSVAKMIIHPSYLRIIGIGRSALPLLLKELRDRPDHWLVALNAITGEDPAPEGANFGEAVGAWVKWGEKMGYC